MRKHDKDSGVVAPDRGQPPPRGFGSKSRLWFLRSAGFWTLVISLLFHVGALVVLPLLLNNDPDVTRAEALRMWLNKKPPSAVKDAAKAENKTIVQITPTFKKERPDQANYLAEQDTRTDKEQRAKPSTGEAQKPALDDSKEKKPTEESQTKPQAAIGHKPIKQARKNDPLGLRPQFSDDVKAQAAREFLPELDEGDETQLNTWQWRHAPFFNRIKSRIGQVWSPQQQIARFDPQGVLLGQKDRVTVLHVTIDRNGYLRDIKITDQSGVAYLDDEAERAFRVAAPFLYPPQELFSSRDEFSFTFAFHLYIDRGFSFGFDWQNN